MGRNIKGKDISFLNLILPFPTSSPGKVEIVAWRVGFDPVKIIFLIGCYRRLSRLSQKKFEVLNAPKYQIGVLRIRIIQNGFPQAVWSRADLSNQPSLDPHSLGARSSFFQHGWVWGKQLVVSLLSRTKYQTLKFAFGVDLFYPGELVKESTSWYQPHSLMVKTAGSYMGNHGSNPSSSGLESMPGACVCMTEPWHDGKMETRECDHALLEEVLSPPSSSSLWKVHLPSGN